jgi:hypothetical protein
MKTPDPQSPSPSASLVEIQKTEGDQDAPEISILNTSLISYATKIKE